MSKYMVILCLLTLFLFCPIAKDLRAQEMVWSDDFEQDPVGGPAKGWVVNYGSWIVAFDSSKSTKVYRCSAEGGIGDAYIRVVPMEYEIQLKLKVVQARMSAFHVGFSVDGTMWYHYCNIEWPVEGIGLIVTNTLCNCPYIEHARYDLNIGVWYIFKVILNNRGRGIYFKVWREGEPEPSYWNIATDRGKGVVAIEPGFLGLDVYGDIVVDFDDVQVFNLTTGVKSKSWGEIKDKYRLRNH